MGYLMALRSTGNLTPRCDLRLPLGELKCFEQARSLCWAGKIFSEKSTTLTVMDEKRLAIIKKIEFEAIVDDVFPLGERLIISLRNGRYYQVDSESLAPTPLEKALPYAIVGYVFFEQGLFANVQLTEENFFDTAPTYYEPDLSLRWQLPKQRRISYAADSESIFGLGIQNGLVALAVANGEERWSKSIEDLGLDVYEKVHKGDMEAVHILRLFEDLLIFSLKPYRLVAVNKTTAEVVWQQGRVCHNLFAVTEDGRIFAQYGGELIQLDARTGDVINRRAITGALAVLENPTAFAPSSLSLSSTHLWVAWGAKGGGTEISAINLETAEVAWSTVVEGYVSGDFEIQNNRLYLVTMTSDSEGNPLRVDYYIEGAGGCIAD